jgi:hypothetical protein
MYIYLASVPSMVPDLACATTASARTGPRWVESGLMAECYCSDSALCTEYCIRKVVPRISKFAVTLRAPFMRLAVRHKPRDFFLGSSWFEKNLTDDRRESPHACAPQLPTYPGT